MSIEIDDPPDTRACSTCMQPLTWIYVYHLSRTIAVVPVRDVDRWTFRLHTCPTEDRDKHRHPWKYVQTQSPETARRGARRARAVLAAKAKRRKCIEEETDHG